MKLRKSLIAFVVLCTITATLSAQTAQDDPTSPITAQNADQIVELERIGNGLAHDVAWSPDGQELAVAGSLGVWVFDEPFGEPQLLGGHTRVVNAVAYSPVGDLLASASVDKTVRLWDANTKSHVATLTNHTATVANLVFNPEGTLLATGDREGVVYVWDVQTHEPLHRIDTNESQEIESHEITSLAFSPDGTMLAWGTDTQSHTAGGQIWLWHIVEEEEPTFFSSGAIINLKFSPDGAYIIAFPVLRRVLIWDIENEEEVIQVGPPNSFPLDLTFWAGTVSHYDGGVFTGHADGQIAMWSGTYGESVRILRQQNRITAPDAPITGLEAAPNKPFLAAIVDDRIIEVYDYVSGFQMTINHFSFPVREVAVDANNDQIAFARSEPYRLPRIVEVWSLNPPQRRFVHEFEAETPEDRVGVRGLGFNNYPLAFNAEPYLMLIANDQLLQCIYSCGTNFESLEQGYYERFSRFLIGGDETVISYQFDEEMIAITTEEDEQSTIVVFENDIDTWPSVATLEPPGPVGLGQVNRDERRVIFVQDDQVRGWDIESNTIQTIFDPPNDQSGLDYSLYPTLLTPDETSIVYGKRLTSFFVYPTGLYVWNLIENQPQATLIEAEDKYIYSQIETYQFISALGMSPDGTVLVAGIFTTEGTTLRLWDMETYTIIRDLPGHVGSITDVEFSEDGSLLVTGSMDGTVRIWGVPE